MDNIGRSDENIIQLIVNGAIPFTGGSDLSGFVDIFCSNYSIPKLGPIASWLSSQIPFEKLYKEFEAGKLGGQDLVKNLKDFEHVEMLALVQYLHCRFSLNLYCSCLVSYRNRCESLVQKFTEDLNLLNRHGLLNSSHKPESQRVIRLASRGIPFCFAGDTVIDEKFLLLYTLHEFEKLNVANQIFEMFCRAVLQRQGHAS